MRKAIVPHFIGTDESYVGVLSCGLISLGGLEKKALLGRAKHEVSKVKISLIENLARGRIIILHIGGSDADRR